MTLSRSVLGERCRLGVVGGAHEPPAHHQLGDLCVRVVRPERLVGLEIEVVVDQAELQLLAVHLDGAVGAQADASCGHGWSPRSSAPSCGTALLACRSAAVAAVAAVNMRDGWPHATTSERPGLRHPAVAAPRG